MWFHKWLQFQESMDLIFIVKEMAEEIKRLKQMVRESREKEVEPELVQEEAIEEPEEIEEVVSEQIYEPLEEYTPTPKVKIPPQINEMLKEKLPIDTEKLTKPEKKITEEEKMPIEISEFVCPKCGKKCLTKSALLGHIKFKHKEDVDEAIA